VSLVGSGANGTTNAMQIEVDCPDENFNPVEATISGATQETTIVWYERYTTWDANNSKSIRPFYDSDSGNGYIAGMIYPWFNHAIYMSQWATANLHVGDTVTSVNTDAGFCDSLGGGNYTCNQDPGDSNARMSMTLTGGLQDTNWHKMRLYIKNPTAESFSDGAVTLWIDEVVIFELTSLRRKNYGSTSKNKTEMIRWFPSDDCDGSTPYFHQVDEIVVNSGYVPPDDTPEPPTRRVVAVP